MIIQINLKTLALTTEGHVPLTDMALVRGDKIPLRIVLTNGPGMAQASEEIPVLAVKTSLGTETLVLAATGLERVEDALGSAYVGSLNVNTTQLAQAMGEQTSINLVGEIVMVAPDGAQRTSQLIRVLVRSDILPAEYAPPTEVLADWHELISDALASQLPDALQDAGMYVSSGSGSTSTYPMTGEDSSLYMPWSCWRFIVGDDAYRPWRGNRCKITSLQIVGSERTLELLPYTPPAWLDIYVRRNGAWVLLATSDQACSDYGSNICDWAMSALPVVSTGDEVAVYLYAMVDGVKMPVDVTSHPCPTSDAPGRGLSITPEGDITDATRMPRLSISYMYSDAVSVGGIALATTGQVDQMANMVAHTGAQVHQSAARVDVITKTFTDRTVPQAQHDITSAKIDAQEAVNQTATAARQSITPLVTAAQTAAGNAAQSSTAAANSATSAQQALAAMPTVDAAGNMGLPGNLTAAGATVNGQLNANGGINIPVPPVADTDGINRLYASGLVSVMETMRVQIYLSKTKSTLTQGAFTEPVPGQVLSAPVAAKSRQRLSIGLDYTMHAASNYSQGLGWVLPLRSTVYGQLKVSVSYGHGVYTAASSDDMDAYEIYPTDASKQAFGTAIDIYLDQTNIGGNRAAVRTRVIYHDQVTGWMVRTITAHVDIFNTGLIGTMSAIVYQQHSDRVGSGVKPDHGSIWLIRNGMASKNMVKIADVPGIHCYNGAKLNSPVLINGKAEDIYANVINVGAPMMQLACGNGRNPAYYGFQALETNAVISMTTAPYEPPTNV